MNKKSYVLVVDEKNENILYLTSIFNSDDIEIKVAENGESALNMINKLKPKYILLDILMPKLKGFEAIKKIQKISEKKSIPVLLYW